MGTDHEKAAEIGSPCLLILPRRSLPPDEFCRGTRPIHAANCRPDLKSVASVTIAAMAVIGPISRYRLEAPAQFTRSMPGMKLAIHLADLLVHLPQLPDQGRSAARASVGMRLSPLSSTNAIMHARPAAEVKSFRSNPIAKIEPNRPENDHDPTRHRVSTLDSLSTGSIKRLSQYGMLRFETKSGGNRRHVMSTNTPPLSSSCLPERPDRSVPNTRPRIDQNVSPGIKGSWIRLDTRTAKTPQITSR